MSNLTPTPKMAATGTAGAAALVLIWAVGLFGIELPPEVAGAAVIVIAWVVGYLVPDKKKGDHAAD